jgi:kinetochore protein NDC80
MVISVKQMQTPSAKDFTRVLEFLVRQMDPSFELTGKIDVEVPELFRQLGYSFPITKNALVAIGAPNTWPSLLAALDWLVDTLTYSQNILDEPRFDEDSDEQAAVAEKMLKAYGLFITHQDYSEDLQDLKNQLKEKMDTLALQTLNMKQTLAAIKAEKESLKQSLVNPKLLDSQIACLEQEVRTLANVDIALQKKKALEMKLAYVKDELMVATDQQKSLEQSITTTKDRIDKQEFTQEGLLRMEKQKETLESQALSLRKDREEAAQMAWDLEQKLKDAQSNIALLVRDFNATCADFKLTPKTAKNAIGVDFTLGVSEGEEPVSNLACLVKLPEVVKAMRTRIDGKIEAKEKALVAMEQELHSKQQLKYELDSQEKTLQDTVKSASGSSQLGLASMMDQIERRSRENSDLDQEIKRMKDVALSLSAQMADMTNRQDSLQMTIEHKQQEHARVLADCVALIEADCEAANVHNLEAMELSAEIVAFSRARLE